MMIPATRKIRTAAFLFLALVLSVTAGAQVKKLEEANGFKSYHFGDDRSAFTDILEPTGETGSYKVKLYDAQPLQEAFGQETRNVYFRFDNTGKLREIKIYYPNVDKEMNKEETNAFLSRIPSAIIAEYGKSTSQRGLFPNMEMSWTGKNIYLLHSMTMTMGTWQRTITIMKL